MEKYATGEVLVSDISLERDASTQELSANVDGERVWFRFPSSVPIELRPEPFLPLALMEAMVRGVPIRVERPHTVSARLAGSFERIQQIFTSWNSEDFRVVALISELSDTLPQTNRVVSCYSGGIDSSYTYACFKDEITHLLLAQGFDGIQTEEQWQKNIEARQCFANQEGKPLVPVANNAREFLEGRLLSFEVAHGSLLAGVGLALGAGRILIPSSSAYGNLFPWGSHPLLDPLWSTEATEVVHHGLELSRTGKIEFISHNQHLLDHLQVCWKTPYENCGQCPKCVRTSLVLHLLGKTSVRMPPFNVEGHLRFLKPGNHVALAHLEDIIRLCRAKAAAEIERRLMSFRRRFLVKYHASEIFKLYIGKILRRLSRRLWPKEWHRNRARIQGTPLN